MGLIQVKHQFHAVGHGTFFTSNVEDFEGGCFRWGYDCGSKRPSRVEEAVETLTYSQAWLDDTELDMVVVSHFDNDHINGLELLLERHKVKQLVLPYMSLKTRLAHMSSSNQGEACSASTASFTLNPAKHLVDRGLSGRVGTIVMVRGGGEGGALDVGAPLPDPGDPDAQVNFRWDDVLADEDADEYSKAIFARAVTDKPQVQILSHHRPVKASSGLPFEFIFYNTALPSGVTKRSGLPLSAVHSEIDFIFRTYRLQAPGRKPRKGWRKRIKECYDKHFGSNGHERNDISLCVLARPLINEVDFPECVLGTPTAPDCDEVLEVCPEWPRCPLCWPNRYVAGCERSISPSGRQALLLTGDLALDCAEIGAMQGHFGNWRWQQIGLAQVPHHGSRHSWTVGNAARFGNAQFVQCVPTVSKYNDHPHPAVVADLGTTRTHVANYEDSVVRGFCFRV